MKILKYQLPAGKIWKKSTNDPWQLGGVLSGSVDGNYLLYLIVRHIPTNTNDTIIWGYLPSSNVRYVGESFVGTLSSDPQKSFISTPAATAETNSDVFSGVRQNGQKAENIKLDIRYLINRGVYDGTFKSMLPNYLNLYQR